jgi:hypothetical protein
MQLYFAHSHVTFLGSKRIFHLLVVDENGYYPTLSNNDDVSVADVGDADRGSDGHIVVEVDTLFEKEWNTKE